MLEKNSVCRPRDDQRPEQAPQDHSEEAAEQADNERNGVQLHFVHFTPHSGQHFGNATAGGAQADLSGAGRFFCGGGAARNSNGRYL